jgi:hypothetical protein
VSEPAVRVQGLRKAYPLPDGGKLDVLTGLDF